MDYRGMIEAYLLSRQNDLTNKETFRRYKHQLTESVDFLISSEYSLTDDKNLEALNTYLQGKYAEVTARKRMNLARKFLAWIESQKGEDKMMNEQQACHERTEEISDMAEAEKVSKVDNTPSTESEQTESEIESHASDAGGHEGHEEGKHEQKKSGRPRLGTEARTERVTVYLTPTLYKEVKILANLDDVTIPNFIFGVLQKTVDANQEDINEQLQLQEKRKSRQG